TLIAEGLGVSAAKVYGVATFYAHFTLEPKGKHVIRCCDGTACHVKGSMAIMDAIRNHLNLAEGQKTTKDGMFSFEIVSCLGACGLAPVMVLDEKVHGQSNDKVALDAIKECIASEEK
ncbi:MAG: NAD(P)H-dependent oxidoreductase subunit E, partial [Proteobacteria bacterium]|nr:NAD(P)H-dependent oxidoreductase subunit E [Pseudomonadota bacterium]